MTILAELTEELRKKLETGGKLALFGRNHDIKKYANGIATQYCARCLKFGHAATVCRAPATCKFCAGTHNSLDHSCQIRGCGVQGRQCNHTRVLCLNCGEEGHLAGDRAAQRG
jgi:hypothetical protein